MNFTILMYLCISSFAANKNRLPKQESGFSKSVSSELLQLDRCAGLFELLLELLSLSLANVLLDRLRCAVNELLRFLQAESRCLTDSLDDVDLLVASGCENDRELRLLLAARSRRSSTADSSNSNRCSCADTELLLHSLDELGEFENGHVLNGFQNLILVHIIYLQKM